MKRFFIFIFFAMWPLGTVAAQLPDNMYFRAMNDEMQRALQGLRLKDHPKPYFIAYWLSHHNSVTVRADMGTLAPAVHDPNNRGDSLVLEAFVSVGSDKQDGLGFADAKRGSWAYYNAQMPYGFPTASYDSIRQNLWKATDEAYLQAADLYKKKQAYKQKKNIQDPLPDVVPAPAGHFTQDIPPFVWPDVARLEQQVKDWSALGKKLPFLESFNWELSIKQMDWYYLNSRGAFSQYAIPSIRLDGRAVFRQPDGKTSEVSVTWWLKDTATQTLEQTTSKVEKFLSQIKQAHGASSGEAYVGPVLLKPAAAARFVRNAVLFEFTNSKPWLLTYADDDEDAGLLFKKKHVRVSTDLLTVYDRPLARDFEGIPLYNFRPVDAEGVAAENLTLIESGHVKDFPLTRRPLSKHHRSNGHAYIERVYGPREGLTNVFIEPKEQLSDEQMEEKLRQKCRELGLEYGYILYKADPSGDLGIERLYTADGRKETVLNLKWDGNFFTQRDLRGVLAVGGQEELVSNNGNSVLIAPSILMQEVELVPQEHQPHRKPFISKPKID